MHIIGFSTGAVARGDYRAALALLRAESVRAIELSALRLSELNSLVGDIPHLDLSGFSFISFHAPSRFELADESSVIESLKSVTQSGFPVVVHPDTMYTDELWRAFGGMIFIENMDKRKPVGRTARELESIFERFPEAGLCFDIGHARQVDPTMIEAYRILDQQGNRLKQVHMSEANTASHHVSSHHDPISRYAIRAFQRVAGLIPARVPIILETLIDRGQSDVHTEIRNAEMALTEVTELVAIAG
jgi:hypothetical protein